MRLSATLGFTHCQRAQSRARSNSESIFGIEVVVAIANDFTFLKETVERRHGS